jgi:hypothetical protein
VTCPRKNLTFKNDFLSQKMLLAEVANFFQIFVEALFFAVVVVVAVAVVVVVVVVVVVASFCRQDNEDET